ncbi:MAG TPA: hypothetical protein VN939_21040 [Chthoniobacterales bacterium]|nr:hypothetical protein [Chthoniobacterales bacterium]
MKRIPATEMQKLFNEGGYWEKAKSGEFSTVTLEHRHPALTAANEPFCTYSQMISYRDASDNEVARVHQYLRPDGTIGASGKPDPKRLFADGELLRLHKKPKDSATGK